MEVSTLSEMERVHVAIRLAEAAVPLIGLASTDAIAKMFIARAEVLMNSMQVKEAE